MFAHYYVTFYCCSWCCGNNSAPFGSVQSIQALDFGSIFHFIVCSSHFSHLFDFFFSIRKQDYYHTCTFDVIAEPPSPSLSHIVNMSISIYIYIYTYTAYLYSHKSVSTNAPSLSFLWPLSLSLYLDVKSNLRIQYNNNFNVGFFRWTAAAATVAERALMLYWAALATSCATPNK